MTRLVTFDAAGWQAAIRHARSVRAVTERALAATTGLSKNTLHRAFNDPAGVRDVTIVASLSAALGVDFNNYLKSTVRPAKVPHFQPVTEAS